MNIVKTAFSVDHAHYKFVRIPFGLKSAFQRVVYVVSCTYTHPWTHFEVILIIQASPKANLKVLPDKCESIRKHVEYLGHLITQEDVKINPANIVFFVKY